MVFKKVLNRRILRSIILFVTICTLIALILFSVVILASEKDVDYYSLISVEQMKLEKNAIKALENIVSLNDALPVCQNDKYILYVDEITTSIHLFDKDNNKFISTQMTEDQAIIASGGNVEIQNKMQSSLVVTFLNTKSGSEVIYNANQDSVLQKQFSISVKENNVSVKYIMGKVPEISLLPEAFSEERFFEFADKMKSSDREELLTRYTKLELSSIKNREDKEKYLALFSELKDSVIYVKQEKMQKLIIKRIEKLFEKYDYDFDQKYKDEEEVGFDVSGREISNTFTVTVNYLLTQDGLKVSIDKEKIYHTKSFIPISIDLLPFFMSADKQDEGYMLVPDGSGSLIYLNNEKTWATVYSTKVYGEDVLQRDVLAYEQNYPTNMAVMGLKSQEKVLFARIESNAAMATIKADIPRDGVGMNSIFASFLLRAYKKEVVFNDYTTAGSGTVYANKIQPGVMEGIISVDYRWLDVNSGYSKMSEVYRSMLIEDGLKKTVKNSNKMMVTLLGSMDKIVSVAGIPTRKNMAMTTFEQAIDIAQTLNAQQIDFDINYKGAFGGGEQQGYLKSIKFQRELGGSKAFSKLKETLSKQGTNIFLQASMAFVSKNTIFDGFSPNKDASRDIREKTAIRYERDTVSLFYVHSPQYIVSPNKYLNIFEKISKDANKNNIDGLAISYLGNNVSSDFNSKNPIFRDQGALYTEEAIKKLGEEGIGLLLSGGNDYLLRYATCIIDIPMESNKYRLTDESIPFLQMTLHGFIPYYSSPINMEPDSKKNFLKLIETGSGLSAIFSAEDPRILIDSNYTHYYSAEFSKSKDEVFQYYEKYKVYDKVVNGHIMINHRKLATDIYETKYENGITVIVNYSNKKYDSTNGIVNSMDYLLIGAD